MSSETLEIRVTDSGTKEVQRNLTDVGTGAEVAQRKVDALGGALGYLKTALAAAGIGFGIAQLKHYSDEYEELLNKLRQVSASTAELTNAESELFKMSQKTTTSFEGNVEIYSNLSRATKQYGIESKAVLGVTETIANALDASGKSSKQAQGAITQFVKALASGEAGGRTFVALFNQVPLLAQAVAKGLGVPIASLNEMAAAGRITGKDLITALEKSKDFVAQMQSLKVDTISDALGNLNNAALRFVGQMDQAKGASHLLVAAILFLAENFNTLAKILTIVIITYGAYRAALLVTTIVTIALTAANFGVATSFFAAAASTNVLTASIGLLRGLWLSLIGVLAINPFMSFVIIVTLVVSAIYAFGDSIKFAGGQITLLGALTGIWNVIAAGIAAVKAKFMEWVALIQASPAALLFLQGALSVVIVYMALMASSSILTFMGLLTVAIYRVGAAMLTLLLNPIGLATTAFLVGAVAVAYYMGTLDTLIAKASETGAAISNSIVASMKAASVQASSTGTEGSAAFDKLKKSIDDADGPMGEMAKKMKKLGEAGHDAAGGTDALRKSMKGIDTDGDGHIRYWDAAIKKFHDWQMETKNFTTTFEEYQQQLNRTESLDNYIAKMIEIGELSKDWNKTLDYQVGALGRVDACLNKAAGSMNYLAKESAAAGSSVAGATSSANAATGGGEHGPGDSSGTTRGKGSDPKQYQFATWSTPAIMQEAGPAFTRAAQISAQEGVAVPKEWEAITGFAGKFKQFVDFPGKNQNLRAEMIHTLGGLSAGAKQYLSNTVVGGWLGSFRGGGSAMVGGSGGPDSQYMALRATPGERVTVETPEQYRKRRNESGEGKGGTNVYVTMNVQTPDADSFKRSETQMMMELKGKLQRGL